MRILAIAITATVLGASAQEQPLPAQERERALWSTEFRQNRPAPAPPQAASPSTQPAGLLVDTTKSLTAVVRYAGQSTSAFERA